MTNEQIQQIIQQDAQSLADKWHPLHDWSTREDKLKNSNAAILVAKGIELAISNPSRYGIQGLSMEEIDKGEQQDIWMEAWESAQVSGKMDFVRQQMKLYNLSKHSNHAKQPSTDL